jgi:cell division protein FtsN
MAAVGMGGFLGRVNAFKQNGLNRVMIMSLKIKQNHVHEKPLLTKEKALF